MNRFIHFDHDVQTCPDCKREWDRLLSLESALREAKEALTWYSNIEIKSPNGEWFFRTPCESRWQNIWNTARHALAKIEKVFP